jgi:hypothetical protein
MNRDLRLESRAPGDPFAFFERDDLIRRDLGDRLHPPRVPEHVDAIRPRGLAETEMVTQILKISSAYTPRPPEPTR